MSKTMTWGKLLEFAEKQGVKKTDLVILSSDPEGNSYSPLSSEIGIDKYDVEEREIGLGKRCITLYPE